MKYAYVLVFEFYIFGFLKFDIIIFRGFFNTILWRLTLTRGQC